VPNPERILLAAFVAPMSSPIVRDGGVALTGGRIGGVGDARALRNAHPDAAVEDLGDVVLIPGLVNAHTHLELSSLHPGPRPTSFTDWVLRLLTSNAGIGGTPLSTVKIGVTTGANACLKFGVTTVGDVTTRPATTRPILAHRSVRVVSYGEVRGMAKRRGLVAERIEAAVNVNAPPVANGISPHAPYSIERAGYRACLEAARGRGMPICTHLAETAYEAEFLATHGGPFRELWAAMNAWDDDVPRFDGGPIRFAKDVGLLDHPTLLAHVNYCDDAELALLSKGRASVVYCPRTHAYFGHPPHRWRDMLRAGINVAIGTDSCASSPDLNVVDDLRLVHRIAPDHPVDDLWRMVTTRAARAIQMDARVGSLDVGKAADFVTFGVTTDDPLREVLAGSQLPTDVWIQGAQVSSHGTGRAPRMTIE
jgi:cytosine/adenosine deaminase-related metal-dependent hydrolase